MRRSYGERVTLHQAPAPAPAPKAEEKAEPAASIRIPESPIDLGSSSSLPDQLAPTAPPVNVTPPRDNRNRDDKPWSLQKEEPANKPTGWGWLADEIMKTSAPTAQESKVEARYPGLGDPFAESEVDPYADLQGEDNDSGRESPKETSSDRRETPRTKEESAAPVVATETSWKPVGLDARRESWDQPASPEREGATGLATDALSGLSFAIPNLLNGEQGRSDEENDNQRRDPDARALASPADRRILDQERSLFRPTSVERDSSSEWAGSSLRPTSAGSGLFAPVGASAGQAENVFGGLSPAPSFGAISAMEIQPSLSVPAPVTPSITLPSQAPTTPSLGGMGRELDNLPKTMPW